MGSLYNNTDSHNALSDLTDARSDEGTQNLGMERSSSSYRTNTIEHRSSTLSTQSQSNHLSENVQAEYLPSVESTLTEHGINQCHRSSPVSNEHSVTTNLNSLSTLDSNWPYMAVPGYPYTIPILTNTQHQHYPVKVEPGGKNKYSGTYIVV